MLGVLLQDPAQAGQHVEHPAILREDVGPEQTDPLRLRVAQHLGHQDRPEALSLPPVLDDDGNFRLLCRVVILERGEPFGPGISSSAAPAPNPRGSLKNPST